MEIIVLSSNEGKYILGIEKQHISLNKLKTVHLQMLSVVYYITQLLNYGIKVEPLLFRCQKVKRGGRQSHGTRVECFILHYDL